MADIIVGIYNTALVAATDMWTRIVDETGLWKYYLGVMALVLCARYLLIPVVGRQVNFGAGSSDMAQGKYGQHLRTQLETEQDLGSSIAHGALDD